MDNKKTLEKIEEILIDVDEGKLSNSKGIKELMKIVGKWRNSIIESHIISSKDLAELKRIKKQRKRDEKRKKLQAKVNISLGKYANYGDGNAKKEKRKKD